MVGRTWRRYLRSVLERARPGAGWAFRFGIDPDLRAAGDGPPSPVGWVPLAAIDATYATLLGLAPLTRTEAAAAIARAVGSGYDGRLRRGATIGG